MDNELTLNEMLHNAIGDGRPAGIPYSDSYKYCISTARQIMNILSRAVRDNTGIETGYFSGVSVEDIADIIERHDAKRGE